MTRGFSTFVDGESAKPEGTETDIPGGLDSVTTGDGDDGSGDETRRLSMLPKSSDPTGVSPADAESVPGAGAVVEEREGAERLLPFPLS